MKYKSESFFTFFSCSFFFAPSAALAFCERRVKRKNAYLSLLELFFFPPGLNHARRFLKKYVICYKSIVYIISAKDC